jgi:hypothetical protein
MISNLTEDNFLVYALKCYSAPRCIMSEFEADIRRTKYIKKLIRKYNITQDLKERLILNHIILLSNVFGPEPTTKILFFKFDVDDYGILKTFLIYLNMMPDIITGINGKNIHSDDILIDMNVANKLREL